MIHLLKANTKPIGTEYKRRIVPIASTLADFQANQQVQEMAAADRAKASKRKKQEAVPVQKPQASGPNEIGNAHDQVQEERPVSAESKAGGDVDMVDGYKDMSS